MKEERIARNKLVAQEKPPAANTLFIYHREQHNVTSPNHTHITFNNDEIFWK